MHCRGADGGAALRARLQGLRHGSVSGRRPAVEVRMTNGKTPANDETEAGAAAETPSGHSQADGPLFEARQPEIDERGTDEAGPTPFG